MFRKAPKPRDPDMTLPLGGLKSKLLEGGARRVPVELNRDPAIPAAEVDKKVGFPIGNLAAAMTLPTRDNMEQVAPQADAEARKERLARQKDMTVYVFDEGEATGRHADRDQPRYTVMGPHALEEIAAEAAAPGGYIPRHAAAPKGYKSRHRGRAEQPVQPAPEQPARRHRAPIAQLGAGESLEVGKERWIPAAGIDAISRDAELQEHYERSGRVQGEFAVDAQNQITYEDRGTNPSTFFYQNRTPSESRQHLADQFAAQRRQASVARGQRQLEWEWAHLPLRPYPPVADVYVHTQTHAPHIPSVFDDVPHQHRRYDDPTSEQPGGAAVGARPLQPV